MAVVFVHRNFLCKLNVIVIVIFFIIGIVTPTGVATSSSSSRTSLRIIQINDVYELDNFPKLKSLIDYYKNNNDSNSNNDHHHHHPQKSIVICAGDFLSPSLLSSLDKGFAMVDVLNEIGIDYVCIGNHEADIPNDALALRIRQSKFDWINSNMQDLNDKLQVETPAYKILEIGNDNENDATSSSTTTTTKTKKRRIALLGFMTDDTSLYRPGAFGGATITPILTSAKYWIEKFNNSSPKQIIQQNEEKLDDNNSNDSSSSSLDIILCMTHQGITADRKMAQEFGGHQFPLLMGGHDHEPYDEMINGCRLIKTGMNAHKAAIIDIIWDDDISCENGEDKSQSEQQQRQQPTISVKIVDTDNFPPDPIIEQRVQGYQEIIKQLDVAKLFTIKDWVTKEQPLFSTKNNRLGPSPGTTAFCSMLRMGLRCQVCLLHAGCIRAGKDYPDDYYFRWSDLKAEMPFATQMSVCYIPGRVIQDTIRHSRQWGMKGIPKGGYIHASRTCVVNDDGTIESILGQPFDPDREYLTAFPHCFLTGIDNHEPLLEWAKTKHPRDLPSEHAAVPAKFVLVEFFSALLWLRLGNFDEIAGDDGIITKEDVRERMRQLYDGNEDISDLMVENVFGVADIDQSGTISVVEQMIVHFAATDMLNHVITDEELSVMTQVAEQVLGSNRSQEEIDLMVQQIQKTLDVDGSGVFEREELLKALGEVTGKDFLH